MLKLWGVTVVPVTSKTGVVAEEFVCQPKNLCPIFVSPLVLALTVARTPWL